MSTVLKAEQVRLGSGRFLDSGTREEAGSGREEQKRLRTAQALFRRRIGALKEEGFQQARRLEELLADMGRRLEEARAEGHAAGLLDGRRQVEEELAEAFRLLAMQEEEFRRAAADYHRQADRELVRLARWMAETVLRRALPLDEEALARRVRDLLEDCLDQQTVRLHLHPGERRRILGDDLEERLPRLAELIRSLAGRLEWVEAAEVPPGACRVELHDGLLEAGSAAMLDHLEEELVRQADEAGR
ncbi:MAG: FliH/SctL family protein [bacterium]|jgi:flagellar biosynthesis/type III secretory pathway protein FliH|nr:FliH/SctL family protein [bacterium]